MNLNKVFILGNLTRDPELRQTPSGQAVATLGIATNSFFTDRSGNRQSRAEFHTVVLWGKQAELANQFLTKGGIVLVEGRLQTRSWEGKDGQPRKVTEIVGERVQFGPRPSGGGQGKAPSASSEPAESRNPEEEMPVIDIEKEEINPEDLPF